MTQKDQENDKHNTEEIVADEEQIEQVETSEKQDAAAESDAEDNSEHEYEVEFTEANAKPAPLDSELANIIEAALYAAKEPLGVRKLISLFPEDAQPTKVDIQNVILALQEQCEHRGIELRRIGKGWRYQTKEKYAPWLRKLSGQKAPRYSRALLETLSIIAYRQPVTRGDIEEIRGVGVSSDTIRTLEERGWVAQIGHRDVPGRPALFGTSQGFLEYFNMSSLSELPELMEKRELGVIAKDMNLTLPMDGVQDETNNVENPSEDTAEVIELHPKTGGEQTRIDMRVSDDEDSVVTGVDGENDSLDDRQPQADDYQQEDQEVDQEVDQDVNPKSEPD